MALTIYDIAKKANVSIATVSRVLNNKGVVSEKTRQKIMQVLEDSDYTPSQVARGLAGKATHTIGVVAMDLRELNHSSIIYHLEQELSHVQYSCMVQSLGGNYQKLPMYLDMMESRGVDGMVFVGSVFADKRCTDVFKKRGLATPGIIVNAEVDLPGFYCVTSDDRNACAKAVQFLRHECGKKRIALVHNDDTLSDRLKRAGYNDGMREAGLGRHVNEIIAEVSMEGGAQAVEYAMQTDPLTDGFLFTKDYLAAGGIHALHRLGYKIPEDVALVSVNNSVIAQVTWPALTSLDYRTLETAEAVVGVLQKLFDGEEPPKTIVVPCNLVQRGTT